MTMSGTDEQQRPVDAGAVTVGRHRYLRAPVPVIFPEHEEVGEHKLHLELKMLLFEIGPSLRLSRDEHGEQLYLSAAEAAAQRIRELEAELARRQG